jgi:serine/threonine-protein kinase
MNERQPPATVSPQDFRRIRTLFEAALQRPLDERRAFVTAACNGDTALLAEVEMMLAAEARAHSMLDRAAGAGVLTPVPRDRDVRFQAGDLFARRFRIVSALGHGGMGDVYRADDLELGQPVALKLLPTLSGDAAARTRLRNEVRLARQISHPHVCRVYDIGEASGQLYLVMEYIDGEDLASLLRRIRRLPSDRATEFARQLCAGLAAAHARGVLHRDLKPANVMVDGRGDLHITDFGLAALAGHVEGIEIKSGTPAYMAPEQLAGREAIVQSDLYALGLVLYEMFTGKTPFDAKTPADLLRARESDRPTHPSSWTQDLDPAVERAILRCLEADPKRRPPSALAVAASLPGGDPVAEALAAGETPSPEMVAASGSKEGLPPVVAWSLLGIIGVGLVVTMMLVPRFNIINSLPLRESPEVLASKARDVAATAGYSQAPVDSAFGFQTDDRYVEYLSRRRSGIAQWNQAVSAPPFPMTFWYRQSLRRFVDQDVVTSVRGVVGPDFQVSGVAGDLSVGVDLNGRLLRFAAVPLTAVVAQRDSVANWPALFRAARLDMQQFSPADPEPAFAVGPADARMAWTGRYDGRSDLPVRIEGASLRGQIVAFAVVWPWDVGAPDANVDLIVDVGDVARVQRTAGAQERYGLDDLRAIPIVSLALALIIAQVVFAVKNYRANRIDGRGAWRVGLTFGTLSLIGWVLRSHHPGGIWSVPAEIVSGMGLPQATLIGLSGATAYLAAEPWVRRYWPEGMISWSRLISGQWRDPLVGRDVLVALVWSLVVCLSSALIRALVVRNGGAPAIGIAIRSVAPYFFLDNLLSSRFIVATVAGDLATGIGNGLRFCFVLFVFRMLFRNRWLGAAGIAAIVSVISTDFSWPATAIVVNIVTACGLAVLTVLFGVVAAVVASAVPLLIINMLITTDFSAWYGTSSLVAVVIVAVLALWAFRASLGERAARPEFA